MLLCYAAWGVFFFFLHSKGVNYTRHFLWTTTYFAMVGSVTALIFWRYTVQALQNFTLTPLFVLAAFMLVQAILYTALPRYLPEPKGYFEQYPTRYYLRLEPKRLVSKSADILTQQVFIVLLVSFLRDAGFSLVGTIVAFTILFGILHIPLISSEWGAWPAWLFAGAVVSFGGIFPILIITVRYGFVYNILIHWSFYTVTAIFFWIRYSKDPTTNAANRI